MNQNTNKMPQSSETELLWYNLTLKDTSLSLPITSTLDMVTIMLIHTNKSNMVMILMIGTGSISVTLDLLNKPLPI
jgi:hypothetical protein